MDNLSIKISNDILEDLLNTKLVDMFCKHVVRHNIDNVNTKAERLYI